MATAALDFGQPAQTLVKTVEESARYSFDFTDDSRVPAGATVAAATVTVEEGLGLTVSGQALAGLVVQATYAGGLAGTDYVVKCKVTLTDVPPSVLVLRGVLEVTA